MARRMWEQVAMARRRKRTGPGKGIGVWRRRRRRQALSRCGCGSGGRDWAALPGPALFCILKCMARGGRLADIRAFARVCRTWRSSAFVDDRTGRRVLSVAPCLPPLILSYSVFSRPQENDYFLRLLSLPRDGYYSMKAKQLPPVLLGEYVNIVGCSCGYVVVTYSEKCRGNDLLGAVPEHNGPLFLVDLFADRAEGVAYIELPRARSPVYHALLTAPPPTSSSDGEGDCVVVALSSKCIQYCRVGVGVGGVTAWGEIVSVRRSIMPFIHYHSVAIGGKVYILLQTGDILVLSGFSLPGPPSMTLVDMMKSCLRHPTAPFMLRPLIVTELNGEILVLFQERLSTGNSRADVLFDYSTAPRRGPYLACRLDLSRREWVRMDSLGDYSVFLGSRTGQGMACRVAEWGGRKNCIYHVEPLKHVSVRNMQGVVLERHYRPELLNILANTFWVPPTTVMNRCV